MENQPNQAQPIKSSNQALWIILVLVVLALAGYGIYAYVSGQNNENTNNTNTTTNLNTNSATNNNTNTVANSNTNTTVNSNTNTTANTDVDTSGWKTHENDTYGYTVKYPDNWRIAENYMKAFAEVRHPQNKNLVADYVVITKLTGGEEEDFITYAKGYVGIAARPWYDFSLGKSVNIIPSNSTLEDYKKEIPQGSDTITQIPSNIREVTLTSGQKITRLESYQKNDNGEFTYEIALFPVTGKSYKYLEVRVETNQNNYESIVFENLLNTINIQ